MALLSSLRARTCACQRAVKDLFIATLVSRSPMPDTRSLIPDTRTSSVCPNRTKKEHIFWLGQRVKDFFPSTLPTGRSPTGSAPSLRGSLATMPDVYSAILGRDSMSVNTDPHEEPIPLVLLTPSCRSSATNPPDGVKISARPRSISAIER